MDYQNYPVVKTHLLPHQLLPNNHDIPAVYLVRDGRDALVSMAHHRKDIVETGSDFRKNLIDAIIAPMGTHFGGWSKNASQWLERASIVIQFEDLINHPIECVERIRPFIDLPEPKTEKLPSFNDLRIKPYRYGGGRYRKAPELREERQKIFFRRGKIGSWKDEMPDDLHTLFWKLHGKMMDKLGYEKTGDIMHFNNFKYFIYLYKAWYGFLLKNFSKVIKSS